MKLISIQKKETELYEIKYRSWFKERTRLAIPECGDRNRWHFMDYGWVGTNVQVLINYMVRNDIDDLYTHLCGLTLQ